MAEKHKLHLNEQEIQLLVDTSNAITSQLDLDRVLGHLLNDSVTWCLNSNLGSDQLLK